MNKQNTDRRARGLSSCSVATVLLFTSLAFAKSYDIVVDTQYVKASPVEQALPILPEDAGLKKRQEGWVRVGFDVSPEGEVVDATVLDSLGGDVFVAAALDAVSAWTFEPSERSVAENVWSVKFKNGDKKESASRNFMRWYNMAARELMGEDLAEARKRLDLAKAQPAWNLYERSLLEVLDSEISAAEGAADMRLASLRRVIHIGNKNALSNKSRRKLLKNIFQLELESGDYMAAKNTLASLREVKGSKSVLESLAEDIQRLEAADAETDEIASGRVRHVQDPLQAHPAVTG